jgi:hypothetical protein
MNNRGRGIDDSVEELSFEEDEAPPRTGDPRIEGNHPDPIISAQRVRQAGAGIEPVNTIDPFLTADDLSPETLLDEDAIDNDGLVVADKELSIVERNEIGGGSGLDEAELAQATGRPD